MKAMDRVVEAEKAVEEVVDVEDRVEDDTSKQSEKWRSSRHKMKH